MRDYMAAYEDGATGNFGGKTADKKECTRSSSTGATGSASTRRLPAGLICPSPFV
jgi:hypothetical protein